MNCLNEYQHELLLSDKASVKAIIWNKHIYSCDSCRKKQNEIIDNISFLSSLEEKLEPDK